MSGDIFRDALILAVFVSIYWIIAMLGDKIENNK